MVKNYKRYKKRYIKKTKSQFKKEQYLFYDQWFRKKTIKKPMELLILKNKFRKQSHI
jgi:hypothetical protein